MHFLRMLQMLKSFLENMGEGRLVLENTEMIHFNADDTGKKSMLSLTQVQACSAKKVHCHRQSKSGSYTGSLLVWPLVSSEQINRPSVFSTAVNAMPLSFLVLGTRPDHLPSKESPYVLSCAGISASVTWLKPYQLYCDPTNHHILTTGHKMPS